MDRITLKNTIPEIFRNETDLNSEIWLQDISFEREKYYRIEANSGTGKSSLCSYLYGYRADYSGDILFNRHNIRELKNGDWDKIRCQELSLLFQELNLFPELTALENVMLKNNLTGYKSDFEIMEMFEILGIPEKTNIKIAKMSWGQQQRVAIIRCLCQPFNFLILDEPISHLDDKNAEIMANLIEREVQIQRAGLIVTSIGKHLPLNYTKTYAL